MVKQRIRDWIRKRLCKKNTFKMVLVYNVDTGKMSNRLVCNGKGCDPQIILGALGMVTKDFVKQMIKEGQMIKIDKSEAETPYIG